MKLPDGRAARRAQLRRGAGRFLPTAAGAGAGRLRGLSPAPRRRARQPRRRAGAAGRACRADDAGRPRRLRRVRAAAAGGRWRGRDGGGASRARQDRRHFCLGGRRRRAALFVFSPSVGGSDDRPRRRRRRKGGARSNSARRIVDAVARAGARRHLEGAGGGAGGGLPDLDRPQLAPAFVGRPRERAADFAAPLVAGRRGQGLRRRAARAGRRRRGRSQRRRGFARSGPSSWWSRLGARGCYYDAPQASGYLPGETVPVVDTTGAGDGFVAGLWAALLDDSADLRRARALLAIMSARKW